MEVVVSRMRTKRIVVIPSNGDVTRSPSDIARNLRNTLHISKHDPGNLRYLRDGVQPDPSKNFLLLLLLLLLLLCFYPFVFDFLF